MFSFFKKKKDEVPVNPNELKAFLTGKVIPIEEVNDPVFSSKMLGDGLAIEPASELIVAPCDGVVSTVMADSKHAVGITAANGMELLIHEGIDTVSLNGEGFRLFVNEGDHVKAGDKLIQFDAKLIQSKGYPITCILAVTNSDDYPNMKLHTGIDAVVGETVIAEAE
ncbi:MAG: PTS glucose transporter subunit IIA [Lachnospiraceae bacterium]|nr:PTS glucose transporter subunit IIA [Lachnospiraceae bacterium]